MLMRQRARQRRAILSWFRFASDRAASCRATPRPRIAHQRDRDRTGMAQPGGKQAGVARLLRAVDVRPVDEKMGHDAGALLVKSRIDDPIAVTVVLVARFRRR
jgi:hypothetical protein